MTVNLIPLSPLRKTPDLRQKLILSALQTVGGKYQAEKAETL